MEVSRNWRLQESRYNLVGTECLCCHKKNFPPREVCPYCSSNKMAKYRFCGKGKVESFSTIYDAPAGYEELTPYTVAWVRLQEGPVMTAQLTDIQRTYNDHVVTGIATTIHGILVQLGIGTPVEAVLRKLKEDGDKGMLVYATKFRPDLAALRAQHRGAQT